MLKAQKKICLGRDQKNKINNKVAIKMQILKKNHIFFSREALSEIINGLKPRQLAILAAPQFHFTRRHAPLPASAEIPDDTQLEGMQMDIDDFIYQLHKLYFKSVIYDKADLFFKFVEDSLQGSIESVNLIFSAPYELSARIQERKLSHRLSLFIFYWGAKHPPKANEVRFEEPMRAVVITRPRKKA